MLRCFRDEILLKSFLGRFFVSTYYLLSPPAAKIVASSEFLRHVVKTLIITPLLKIARKRLTNKGRQKGLFATFWEEGLKCGAKP
jgi:hypothetical protein